MNEAQKKAVGTIAYNIKGTYDFDVRAWIVIKLEGYETWPDHSSERDGILNRLIFGGKNDDLGLYKRFPDLDPKHPRRNIIADGDLKVYHRVRRSSDIQDG